MNEIKPKLHAEINRQPYPLLFVTISGAHLYGFPSHDSDYDLRGVHILPPAEVMSLYDARETIEVEKFEDGIEFDLVTHDAAKFFRLLLKPNGYVLEQLFSPLVLHTTPAHTKLKEIGERCITRHHAHHYLGFSRGQWKLLQKEKPRRVKPLLYTYRVLLTGIYLMQTGKIEANLVHLNEHFKLPYIPDLIAQKVRGKEKQTLTETDWAFHETEYARLTKQLEESRDENTLPENSATKPDLNDLLLQLRTENLGN